MRTIKYSTASYANLRENPQYQFAANHALRIYKSNSIYSFIPKNGCSTMRLSLAMANGFVKDKNDFNWIHNNNDTFRADTPSLIVADYTFVILRCPFSRLLSAYLDKIVGLTDVAWDFNRTINRIIEPQFTTFEFFVKHMLDPRIKFSNIHWRPQSDYLVYDKYDDYYSLEQFRDMSESLQNKIGFNVVDARSLTNHGTRQMKEVSSKKESWDLSAFELFEMKQNGELPALNSFYNEELIQDVKNAFKVDLNLYTEKFGRSNLMFT